MPGLSLRPGHPDRSECNLCSTAGFLSYLRKRFFAFGGAHGLTTNSNSSTASSFMTVLKAGLNSPLVDR